MKTSIIQAEKYFINLSMIDSSISPDVLQYLALSLSPVIIIGIWMLLIKISRNKNTTNHDQDTDNKL